MASTPLARLVIVDDEAGQMKALCNTLEHEGYSTTGFTSANQALAELREQEVDLVLTDLMMPEMNGIALLRAALEINPNLVGIVMTGHGTIDTAVEAMKVGALDYILKPFKLSAILPVLARPCEWQKMHPRLDRFQLVDFTTDREEAIRRLLYFWQIDRYVFPQFQVGDVIIPVYRFLGGDGQTSGRALMRRPPAWRVKTK